MTAADFYEDDEEQPELPFELTHRVTWPMRNGTNDSERIYHSRWVEEQNRYSGGLLVRILAGEDGRKLVATDRDSIVAASVVQWLGTNCGRGFIDGCEREIAETDRLKSHWSYCTALPGERAEAELIAAPVADHPMFKAVVHRITSAIRGRYWQVVESAKATVNATAADLVRERLKAATAEESGRRKALVEMFSRGQVKRERVQRGLLVR